MLGHTTKTFLCTLIAIFAYNYCFCEPMDTLPEKRLHLQHINQINNTFSIPEGTKLNVFFDDNQKNVKGEIYFVGDSIIKINNQFILLENVSGIKYPTSAYEIIVFSAITVGMATCVVLTDHKINELPWPEKIGERLILRYLQLNFFAVGTLALGFDGYFVAGAKKRTRKKYLFNIR